ncbi:unnamed protein product, partial [Staurois parvus]
HLSVSISASCQCSHATCQCPSLPHFSAYQCTSMLHISAHLSCLSVSPISATYQCCPSVPPITVSAAYHCPSSVPPISVHQCSLSVPITAASLAHISEEKNQLFTKFY